VSSRNLDWVPLLHDTIVEHDSLLNSGEKPPLLYLTSIGEEDEAGVMGLVLCIRQEPNCHRVRSILSRKQIPLDFNNPDALLTQILNQDLALNVIDEVGRLGCYVFSDTRSQFLPSKHAFVDMESIGDLTSFRWTQGYPAQHFSYLQEFKSVRVEVAALNFKDVMLASGNLGPERRPLEYSRESPLGFEYSGLTEDGQRVCGFSEGQALATNILAPTEWMWKIPKDWTFEEAATFPVVYSTVSLKSAKSTRNEYFVVILTQKPNESREFC
jgi:fatty acid synthase